MVEQGSFIFPQEGSTWRYALQYLFLSSTGSPRNINKSCTVTCSLTKMYLPVHTGHCFSSYFSISLTRDSLQKNGHQEWLGVNFCHPLLLNKSENAVSFDKYFWIIRNLRKKKLSLETQYSGISLRALDAVVTAKDIFYSLILALLAMFYFRIDWEVLLKT